jgi:hypothetical protein
MAPVHRRPISSLARWKRAQSSGGWADARCMLETRIPRRPLEKRVATWTPILTWSVLAVGLIGGAGHLALKRTVPRAVTA